MTASVVPDTVLSAAARLLARRVGLRLDPSIRGRLSRCVLDDSAAHGMEVAAYVDRLDREPALLQSLLDRVTVQESSFFRDPNQFAALRDTVLAGLEGPVSIWSAGCANGQEPYSLAMTLAEAGRLDWHIVASDISTRAAERTRRGIYSSRELNGVPPGVLERSFTPLDDGWQVVSDLRSKVDVVCHNLVADPPPLPLGSCDIVFCRNVLIYFRPEEIVAFVDRLALSLRPGAWLFLGYSESLWQVTDAFELVRIGDAFAYRRRGPELHNPHADGRIVTKPGTKEVRPRTVKRRAARAQTEPRPKVDAGAAALAAVQAAAAGVETTILSAGRGRRDAAAAAGEAAMHVADYGAAITAFRRSAYLDPDEPVAHLRLGLALEAAGDPASARRAYGAARRALGRSDTSTMSAALEGYEVAELLRLLDAKLSPGS